MNGKNQTERGTYEAFRAAVTKIEFRREPSDAAPHWHQAVEILVALKHEVYTLINGEERTLAPGEICIADCYDVHAFNSFGENVIVVILPYEVLTDYLKLRGKRHLATPYVTDRAQSGELYDQIVKLSDRPVTALLQQGYVNVIMGLIVNDLGFRDAVGADIGLMQQVLNYLEENFSEDVTLDALAAKFGYSKYYFSRMFNRFFKFSLNEYLSRLRIHRFLGVMQEDKQADMIGAALDCGFGSFQTFYRCFKKYYGTSPKKYLSNR